MAGLDGVGAKTLAEAVKFIGVGAVQDIFVGMILKELAMIQGLTVVVSRTEKDQLLMKLDGYLRLAAEWSIRSRRDLVRYATG